MNLYWLQSFDDHWLVWAETPAGALEKFAAWAAAEDAGGLLGDTWSVWSTPGRDAPGPVRKGDRLFLGGKCPHNGHLLSDYVGKAT